MTTKTTTTSTFKVGDTVTIWCDERKRYVFGCTLVVLTRNWAEAVMPGSSVEDYEAGDEDVAVVMTSNPARDICKPADIPVTSKLGFATHLM